MKRADKKGKWMKNTSQFRQHDPMSDTYFEPEELVQATDTSWRQANKGIIKLCDDEGILVDDPDLNLDVNGVVVEPATEPAAEPTKTEPVSTKK